VISRIKPEEMKELRNLSGLGNNLNQLTKLAHQAGIYRLAGRCHELLNAIAEALKKFNINDWEDT
jgi:hypothetical protein